MNDTNKIDLFRLLDQFDLPQPANLDDVLLHSSGPAVRETEETYSRANQLLTQELRQGELKQCIHITGVLSALSDPFHRRVCRLASQRGQEFFVAGHVPADAMSSGAAVMNWLRSSWISSWSDRLSAFSLAAQRQVEVARLPELAKLHFSLFNYRYVLLQTEDAEKKTKLVWFLDSPVLNYRLSEKAIQLQESAAPVDPMLFRNELLRICSPSARELLWLLLAKGELDMREVDVEVFASLTAAGLVTGDVESAKVTVEGGHFLRRLAL